MSSVFDDVQLPVDVEIGAQGGPVFHTTVMTLGSGMEIRNQDWPNPRQSWDIGYGIQTLNELHAVRNFFYNRRGRARAFRFKDWSDYESIGTEIPTNGLTGACLVPLAKTYTDGGGNKFARLITRLNTSLVGITLLVNGGSAGSWTISNGLISFSALPAGTLTGNFQFDVPVRFDTDSLTQSIENINAGLVSSVPIIEILENPYTLNGIPIP